MQQTTISPVAESAFISANRYSPTGIQAEAGKNVLRQLPVQCKLNIGSVNDPSEHEADAMADKVMRMPEQNFIQRKCAHCEEEEKAQRKPLASFIQKKETENNSTVSDSVSNQIQSTKGSGNAMPASTKSFMESRFGTDFSNIKIHTGNYAEQLSKDLSAQAFTVGNDIYFNNGKYQPESSDGKRLLAHELTHTIQQSGSIQRDKDKTKEDAEVVSLQKNISAGEWKEAYAYLSGQWMKIMLEKLNALTETEIDALITNADAAKTAKGSVLSEGGKNRCLAAIFSVKSVKKSDWSDANIAIAEQKALTIPFDQRKEIIAFLSGSKSKAAKKLHNILNKPFLGYTASAYDFSDRFLKHSDKLGFDVESTTQTLPTTPWTGDDPDPQSTHTTDTATKSFEQSDIVFFSGHQYAQYKRPGLYTNDVSDSCFNMGAISKKLNKVKLVASTSCATICKDVAKIYIDKFPNALVLGYKYSAPLNGGVVSKAFVNSLVKKGAIDLSSTAGLDEVKDSWKTVTTSNAGKEGQPGMLFGNDVEFFNGKKWQTAKADSKENDCHYH
jgi:hypothetical protein